MSEIRNVLLVSVDCLREDVFREGLEAGLFPNCAALYDGALEFTETYTVANTTDPSLTAFMTAKYPLEHGVVENGWGLDEGHDTAGERFQDAGMDTFGVVSVDHLAAEHSKLDRGFDRYEDGQAYGRLYPILSRIYDTSTFNAVFGAVKNLGIGRYTVKNLLRDLGLINLHCRSARSVTDDAIACLDDVAPREGDSGAAGDGDGAADDTGSGFFGWVHYFDVHEPRNAPRDLLDEHDEYTAAMMRVDDHVGELRAELEARGIADETLVAFTGDHGEALGEHGYEGHGRTLYDEELNVPLAFDHASLPDARVDAQVRTIDVLPTLLSLAGADGLDAAGVPIFEAPADGSLDPADAEPADGDRQLFAMAYPTFGDAVATRTPGWKLIRDREAEVEELYDLEGNPGEHEDLSEEEGARRNALADDLDEWLAGFGEVERQEIDEDTEEMLADLGYVE